MLENVVNRFLDFITAPAHRSVFLRFISDTRVFAVTVIVAGIVATLCFREYRSRTSHFEDLMDTLISSSLEPTPQTHKGLESMLHAFFVADTKAIEQSAVSKKVTSAFNRFAEELEDAAEDASAPVSLQLVSSDRNNVVLKDLEKGPYGGFLFLPLPIVRDAGARQAVADALDEEYPLQATIQLDSPLANDVRMSRLFEKTMGALRGLRVLDGATDSDPEFATVPTQVYLITKNGINRIVDERATDSELAYRDQFRQELFFPSRPYFWDAFRKRSEITKRMELPAQPSASQFFHISKPYFDIGGHGLVVTLAKPIDIPGYPRAVVCLDLPLRQRGEFRSSMHAGLTAMGATVEYVEVTVSPAV